MRPASALFGMSTRGFDQPRSQGQPEQHGQQDHHEDAAEVLGRGEGPAHQDHQNDPQLDDEIRRGELENHGRGEAGALDEQRSRERHGGVGAGARGDTEEGREGQAAGRVVAQQAAHGLVRNDGLHRAREGEAEDERPQHLPGHVERFPQGQRDRVDKLIQRRPPFSARRPGCRWWRRRRPRCGRRHSASARALLDLRSATPPAPRRCSVRDGRCARHSSRRH